MLKPLQWHKHSSYIFFKCNLAGLHFRPLEALVLEFTFAFLNCFPLNYYKALKKTSALQRKIFNSFIVFGISKTIFSSIQISGIRKSTQGSATLLKTLPNQTKYIADRRRRWSFGLYQPKSFNGCDFIVKDRTCCSVFFVSRNRISS